MSLHALFPDGVVVVRATPALCDRPLHPEEARCAEAMGAARRREFALGRACAREALARLGAEGPVLREGRAPRWPDGMVGSLTHCEGFCAAAVARARDVRALGIDAERDAALSPRAAERITAPDEREHLATLPHPARGAAGENTSAPWAALLFSAKEAFYKAWFPLTGRFLGFRDVSLRFDPEAQAFTVRVLRHDDLGPREARGRYALAPPHVITGVALLPREDGWT